MDYKVGQFVRSKCKGGLSPYGIIKEIQDIPEKGIYQLKLESGWCVHPEEKGYGKNTDKVWIEKDV